MNLPVQQQKVKTIRDLLERAKPQIALAVPKHLTPERLLRVGMTAIQRTPKLLECDPQSLLASLMQCAQLGLEPDGILGHAYLVPFKNNKRGGILEAQFMVGYKGLISLARRSGEVQSISAQVVYVNDEFDYCYGLDEKLYHKPAMGERGRPIAAYAIAKFKDGGHAFEVMTYDEIEAIRKRSKSSDDGPWVTDWPEMARKTPLRKLAKYLPLSIEFQRAAALDERVDAGISTFEPGEFPTVTTTSSPAVGNGSQPDPEIRERFFSNAAIKSLDAAMLEKYLAEVASGNKCTVEDIMAHAENDLDNFLQAFSKWSAGQPAQKGKKRTKADERREGGVRAYNPVDVLDDFIGLAEEDMDQALREKMSKNGYDKNAQPKPLDELNRQEKVSLWNLVDKLKPIK